jgi:phage tail-like protein
MSAPAPIAVFGHHFWVRFEEQALGKTKPTNDHVLLCNGAFSEITGLETSMTPFTIAEGGRNRGPAQRTGAVQHATVILKRGILTEISDLYRWYRLVTGGAYAYRLNVIITVVGHDNQDLMVWKLNSALPVKFKMADLNARATEIAIEELHIVHEGLVLIPKGGGR